MVLKQNVHYNFRFMSCPCTNPSLVASTGVALLLLSALDDAFETSAPSSNASSVLEVALAKGCDLHVTHRDAF
jgi:hypothetical protein